MSQPIDPVWIVDDDRSIRWVLERALQKAALPTRCFSSADQVLSALHQATPSVLLTDIRMPGSNGLALLEHIQSQHPNVPVIIMTAYSDLDSTVSAYQGGAFEYLPKPFDVNEAVDLIKRAQQLHQEQKKTHTNTHAVMASDMMLSSGIIGQSVAMQEVFRAIGRLAKSSINVLITGESGTGKELVAKSLYTHSPRAEQPFIALNTAAIPQELLESELFGHERGAFTGAHALRKGRFEQANHGTLFLDEIGDMPAELQTRLLRVLSDSSFYRVGGHTPLRVDVRIIAATHQDLEQRVASGQFREDLFHRLNVIRIHIPPMRERDNDISLLLNAFLHHAANELSVEPKTLSAPVLTHLQTLPWPGNVRQLENLCRWLTVMAAAQEVTLEDLPGELHVQKPSMPTTTEASSDWEMALELYATQQLTQNPLRLISDLTPRFEQVLIQVALRHTQGRKIEAAELLGWGRNTLTRKLKELAVKR